MKRCSQCHFTFEDYEQFCDFDGAELTHHREPLPSSKNISVPLAGSLFLRIVRSRVSLAIFVLAGVVLSALLVGYYDAASQANVDTPETAESRDAVVGLVPPPQAPNQPPAQIRSPDTLTNDRRITAAKDSSPKARRPTTTSRSRARFRSSTRIRKQTRTYANAHVPKESKGTALLKKTASLLKKTVSLLKKPFDL